MNDEHGGQDVARMETALEEMEQALLARYSDVGKSVLELAEGEQRQVNALVERIVRARRQLARARGEVQCGECMTLNTPDSRYCKRCGHPLEEGNKTEVT